MHYTLNYTDKQNTVLLLVNLIIIDVLMKMEHKSNLKISKIANGLYAYLNIGFANTFLFPDLRYGESAKSLLEASLIPFFKIQYNH
jgi:hypothetical protein